MPRYLGTQCQPIPGTGRNAGLRLVQEDQVALREDRRMSAVEIGFEPSEARISLSGCDEENTIGLTQAKLRPVFVIIRNIDQKAMLQFDGVQPRRGAIAGAGWHRPRADGYCVSDLAERGHQPLS